MNSNENLSFSITLPYQQRCDLPDCQKATKRVYRIQQDGYGLSFCSNDHARVGLTNWNENKKRGIRPGTPAKTTIDDTDMLGDNLQEVEEKGI